MLDTAIESSQHKLIAPNRHFVDPEWTDKQEILYGRKLLQFSTFQNKAIKEKLLAFY